MEDVEKARAEHELLEAERRRREEELEALDEMLEQSSKADPTKPRFSLARTPPSTPTPTQEPQPPTSGKRQLTSPEEVQDAVRRRVAERRQSSKVPPIAGIFSTAAPSRTPAPVPPPSGRAAVAQMEVAPPAAPAPPAPLAPPADAIATEIPEEQSAPRPASPPMDKQALVAAVHAAVKGIGVIANASNKLNITDKTTIAGHGQDVLALMAQLTVRLADVELELAATRLQLAERAVTGTSPMPVPAALQQAPSAPNYANALKMPKGKPPMEVNRQGPAVIFYPTSDNIKSSDETKKVLQDAVNPAESGIKVTQVRRVGNSGVVVRTATEESAQKLREAVPPGLRVATPKARTPRVALRYIRAQLTGEETIREIHRVNLADDSNWPLSRFVQECKFGVAKPLGPKFLVILECSKAARDKLVGLGRVYIGWDEAEVCDHIRSTCCSKCQQYGHPEKYCRSKDVTCGKCGELGHRADGCSSETRCCATCKRFKRADADTHTTAAASCPARLHAEQQEAEKTLYR